MASIPDHSAASPLGWRGIVEGFYGPPWTTVQRRRALEFAARHRLNCYVYAPKDDPWHRARWREPYPPGQLRRLAGSARAAGELGLRFVVAIAPGLSMRYGEPAEHEALHAKAESLLRAGAAGVALLFDDIPGFRADDRALGEAHGATVARLAAGLPGLDEPLLVCPADYCGTGRSGYRDGLAAALPPDALITWSGPSVVSAAVSARDVEQAGSSYGRRVVLWDNVPVNDFDRARLYLGPLRDRPRDSALAGLLANPMIEPAASRITLATAADYAADPAGYGPDASLTRALAAEAGADAARLAPLATACGWPPDDDTGAPLRPLAEAALAGDRAAAGRLRDRLGPLADAPHAPPVGEVAVEAEPWLRAGQDMARAARAALELLADGDATRITAVRADLDRAERHWPNVLRDTLSPFVRAVLHRYPPASEEAGAPYALLVAGEVATAGEEALIRLLHRHRLAVHRRLVGGRPPALVVVSRSADAAAAVRAAELPVPMIALFHLDRLGLGTSTGVLLREERVRIVAPGHPLAAGRAGEVRVHRGPAMSRWCEPGPDATVVARGEEEDRPVTVHYPAGATLADGTVAPAARAALFLGRDLLAPWVITDDGVALAEAAVGALLDPPRS